VYNGALGSIFKLMVSVRISRTELLFLLADSVWSFSLVVLARVLLKRVTARTPFYKEESDMASK